MVRSALPSLPSLEIRTEPGLEGTIMMAARESAAAGPTVASLRQEGPAHQGNHAPRDIPLSLSCPSWLAPSAMVRTPADLPDMASGYPHEPVTISNERLATSIHGFKSARVVRIVGSWNDEPHPISTTLLLSISSGG